MTQTRARRPLLISINNGDANAASHIISRWHSKRYLKHIADEDHTARNERTVWVKCPETSIGIHWLTPIAMSRYIRHTDRELITAIHFCAEFIIASLRI